MSVIQIQEESFKERLSKLLNNLPDTPNNIRKAKMLVEFLQTDEQGFTQIAEIKHGIFERIIKDLELARAAHNFFEEIKEEHTLTTFADLIQLYHYVIALVKKTIIDREITRLLNAESLGNVKDSYLFHNLQKLDSQYTAVCMQYQRELSISRDKRITKEVKATDDNGQSITYLLSQRSDGSAL